MAKQRLLPDFQLANGDGIDKPFRGYLADFNILAIRRVPLPSHGPATELLARLLAENRDPDDVTVRGFDIRSPDQSCETCHGPHVVFTGPSVATICDGDGSILRKFGVVGYDRIFVVRAVPQVVDLVSIEEVNLLSMRLDGVADSFQRHFARAPPGTQRSGPPQNNFWRKFRNTSCI